MINDFISLTDKNENRDDELENYIEIITQDLKELAVWLENFPNDSIMILNYGDLLASFPMNSLDKEDSVRIISDFKNKLITSDYESAKDMFKFLIERWTNIEFANQKDLSKSSN